MPDNTAAKTLVYPKPGVTLYLPGGIHGFDHAEARRVGGVPVHPDHAAALKAQLMTADELKAFDAAQDKAAQTKAAEDKATEPAKPDPGE